MSSLLDALPALVWVDDADGATRAVSAGCREYSGDSVEALAGVGWTEHVHPEDREAYRAARGGRPVEVRLGRRDGSWLWHCVRWTAYEGGWIGSASDMEAERALATQLQRSEERRLQQAQAVDFEVWDWDLAEGVPAEWLGRVLDADRERVERGIYDAIASGRIRWVDEFRWLRRDGTTSILIGRGTIVHDAAGLPLRLVGGASDVTARRRAEASQMSSARELRGISAATAVLTKPSELQSLLEQFAEIARELVGGASGTAWIVGEELPAGELTVPLVGSDGALLGGIAVTGTPRERHAKDAATLAPLAQVAATAIEKARLVARLETMAAERIEADRRKDEFLAMLAHELRNPLAPVLTAVELLKTRPAAEVAEHYVGIMERQIVRLTRLVDDLLDVSRITRGKIELRIERIAVQTVVTRAIESTAPAVAAREHTLTVEQPAEALEVDGDPTRLEQVLANLIVNAAKYTDPKGSITVTVAREDTRVRIGVRDTGVGIAPEMQGRIFELFGQVDQSLARSDGGLGIGLTIVQRLVAMHGGTVAAHSEGLGRGSELVVHLPLADPRHG